MIFSHSFCLILGWRKSIIFILTETSSNKTSTSLNVPGTFLWTKSINESSLSSLASTSETKMSPDRLSHFAPPYPMAMTMTVFTMTVDNKLPLGQEGLILVLFGVPVLKQPGQIVSYTLNIVDGTNHIDPVLTFGAEDSERSPRQAQTITKT